MCDSGRAWLIADGERADGERYELSSSYVDVEAARKRIAQAVFRCEVEQLHLADGRRVLVNCGWSGWCNSRGNRAAGQGHMGQVYLDRALDVARSAGG